MKEGWREKPFGEVCEVVGGSQPPKKHFVFEPQHGYVRLVQVRDYKTDKYKTYIPEDKTKKFCNSEDIMIGRYGPPIFGIFEGIQGAYNVALMKAIPDEKILNREFFKHFLKTSHLVSFVEKSSKRAAGQDGVRKDILYTYPVPLPPLAEQEEIVKVLDKAFTAIDQARANLEQNIANAQELFQSKLNQIFSQKGEGWVETTLESVCDFQNGFTFKSAKFRNKGIPILRISNIQNDQIDLRKIVYTDPTDYKEDLERYRIVKGDLMIAMSGATTGKIGINHTDTEFFLNQRVGKFSPKQELHKKFLYFFLLTKVEENLSISAGAAQPNLSTSQIKAFKMFLPSLEEQNVITQKLNTLSAQTHALESHYQTKLAALDELKKSILQKAFAGELT